MKKQEWYKMSKSFPDKEVLPKKEKRRGYSEKKVKKVKWKWKLPKDFQKRGEVMDATELTDGSRRTDKRRRKKRREGRRQRRRARNPFGSRECSVPNANGVFVRAFRGQNSLMPSLHCARLHSTKSVPPIN